MQERTALEDQLTAIARIEQEVDDQVTMIELGEAENDKAVVAEAEAALRQLKVEVARRELEALLSGEADANDTYLEVHAGAGGTESQDWANMLLRMYVRWAEQHGFKVDYIEETDGEEAGIKSATIEVKGRNAYGWLKTENGVHRLVRISPFDSNARRHTSFASVTVYPVVDDRINIDIKEADVRVDTMRSGGAGGQHVNKTESAVRLTHIPTNIVVVCQNDRSQHRNRAQAWQMLRAKLYEAELKKREAESRRRPGRQDRYRLGPPDPLLRAAALSDGEGPAHRRLHLKHRRRARRRYRSVHGSRAGAESVRRRGQARRRRRIAPLRRVPVSAALIQGAPIGRPRMNAFEEIHQPRPRLIKAGAVGRGFERKAQHDVGCRKTLAGEPGRRGQFGFQIIEVQFQLRLHETSGRQARADRAGR